MSGQQQRLPSRSSWDSLQWQSGQSGQLGSGDLDEIPPHATFILPPEELDAVLFHRQHTPRHSITPGGRSMASNISNGVLLPTPEMADFVASVTAAAELEVTEDMKFERCRLQSQEDTARLFVLEDEDEEREELLHSHRHGIARLTRVLSSEPSASLTPERKPMTAAASTQTPTEAFMAREWGGEDDQLHLTSSGVALDYGTVAATTEWGRGAAATSSAQPPSPAAGPVFGGARYPEGMEVEEDDAPVLGGAGAGGGASAFFWPLSVAPPLAHEGRDTEEQFYAALADTGYLCYTSPYELVALREVPVSASSDAISSSVEAALGNDQPSFLMDSTAALHRIEQPPMDPPTGASRYRVAQLQRVWSSTVLRQQLLFVLCTMYLSSIFLPWAVFSALNVFDAAGSDFIHQENWAARSAQFATVEWATVTALILMGTGVVVVFRRFGSVGERLARRGGVLVCVLLVGTLLVAVGSYLVLRGSRAVAFVPVLTGKVLGATGTVLAAMAVLVASAAEVGPAVGVVVAAMMMVVSWLGTGAVAFLVLPAVNAFWLTTADLLCAVTWSTAVVSTVLAISLAALLPATVLRRAVVAYEANLSARLIWRAVRDVRLSYLLRTLAMSCILASILVVVSAFGPLLGAPRRIVSAGGKHATSASANNSNDGEAVDGRQWVALIFATALVAWPFCHVPRLAVAVTTLPLLPATLVANAVLWALAACGGRRALPLSIVAATTGLTFTVVASSIVRSIANAGATLPILPARGGGGAAGLGAATGVAILSSPLPSGEEEDGTVPSLRMRRPLLGADGVEPRTSTSRESVVVSLHRRGGPAAVLVLSGLAAMLASLVVLMSLALLSEFLLSQRRSATEFEQEAITQRGIFAIMVGLSGSAAAAWVLEFVLSWCDARRRRRLAARS